VKKLIEAWLVMAVISARYSLDDVPAAIRHFQEGHARGKIVITM
jgi:NADPH:quinone reductase-like Zn-dependent oxidoreductase